MFSYSESKSRLFHYIRRGNTKIAKFDILSVVEFSIERTPKEMTEEAYLTIVYESGTVRKHLFVSEYEAEAEFKRISMAIEKYSKEG